MRRIDHTGAAGAAPPPASGNTGIGELIALGLENYLGIDKARSGRSENPPISTVELRIALR